METWTEIVEIIRENPNETLTFQVERDNENIEIDVVPKEVEGEGKIGVYRRWKNQY